MTLHEKWFCNIEGKRIGPLSTHQLGEMLQQGAISPKDLVRPENDLEWVRLEEIQCHLPQSRLAAPSLSHDSGAIQIDELLSNWETNVADDLPPAAGSRDDPQMMTSPDSQVDSIDGWLENLPDASPEDLVVQDEIWEELPEIATKEPASAGDSSRDEILEASSLVDEWLADSEKPPAGSDDFAAMGLSDLELVDLDSFDLDSVDRDSFDLDPVDDDPANVLTESDFQASSHSDTWVDRNTREMLEEQTESRRDDEPEETEQSARPDPVIPEPIVESPRIPSPQSHPAPQPARSPIWDSVLEPAGTPQRKKRSGSGGPLTMPSPALLMVLGGVLLLSAIYFLWPSAARGTQGSIAIDGEPLKVGSLSLSSSSDEGKAMSFAVVEGKFQAMDSLPDGSYDAVVVVGDRLGAPVKQLENTAQEDLNGARFRFTIQIDSSNPEIQMKLGSGDAVLLKKSGQRSGTRLE